MKKNKTIAYMLAATLLVGGTFLGTKALFTDKIDTVGELSISTGDVDVEVVGTEGWIITRNGEDENEGTTGPATYDNLKYGDVLTKKIKIKNEGTLRAILTLDENSDIQKSLPEGIEFTASFKTEGLENANETIFEPGQTGDVELKIDVTGYSSHNETEKSINSDNQEAEILNLKEGFVINAKQITKDTVVN